MKIKLLVVSLFIIALTTFPATAASSLPTGTIDIASSDLTYGGYVQFTTTVDGRVNGQAYIYTRLVCWTDPSNVVYQSASYDLNHSYPLTDQSGQGLDWQPDEVPATCQADLVYRIDKQRNSVIESIASKTFTVGS